MNAVLWIFFCFVYSIVSVQTRFIIYSNSTASWFSARKECQNLYNGSMVDVDLIKLVARMNATNRCLRRKQELWLGRVKYTTGHIVYGGCYDTPDTFDFTSVFSNEMSIVKCQMICIHLYAFAIKENVCNCIYTLGDLDGSYKRSSYSKCNFRCLRKYCGYYGGNDTVSIYINSGERSNSKQCTLLKCNKRLQVKTKSIPCSGSRNVSVYCENGNLTRNVDSWNKAAMLCSTQNSYLIRDLSNAQCKEGLKIWSDSRTYRDIFSIHAGPICTVSCLGAIGVHCFFGGPATLSMLGFTSTGIAAGSWASRWMASSGGTVPTGSLFTTLQSSGSYGISLNGWSAVGLCTALCALLP